MLNNGQILQQRYKIVKILGHGGMGAVYLAEDQRLPTKWAIKEMKKAGLSEEEREEAVEFFHSEARLLSELRHRNLPRIVDFFEQDGQLYLVMDYVEGETLEARVLSGGPLPVNFSLELCLQVSDVLDYLHTRPSPVVFRDFKPANVMLTPQDEVKLIDFGIARVFKKDANADTKALGTPGYAAPEQYGRGQSTPRTDLFAFGATMHHALTGRDPTDEPFAFPPITDFRQDLPVEFVSMLDSCLSLKPTDRPDSAFAVKRVLEELLGRTGSSALASRPTTTRLQARETEDAKQAEPIVPTPASTPNAPVPAASALPDLPKVTFSPKELLVKQLNYGEKATLRLKVKSDRAVSLVPNSPHIQVFPDKIGPGSTTATVTINSAELAQGSVFTGAIEVDDIDELALPIEARISTPKASTMTLVGMFTLCVLTLVPIFNYVTTVIAGIVMFSTPKAKRASLKIPWRLTLLFTLAWSGFFVAVGFGLSQVDWESVRQWGESFFA
jgi:serine/threonine protein kinase